MSQSKNFCFTINNYTDENIRTLDSLECQFIIYGKELAPDTGTPHLQGYVVFSQNYRLSRVIKLIPGHIEVAKGDSASNIKYCSKEGRHTVRGDPPASKGAHNKAKFDYVKILAASRSGDLSEIPAEIMFKYPKLVASHRVFNTEATEDKMIWCYGESGTGKSRWARETYPDAYLKMCNKWWDGYNGEEVVIIEDFDKDHKCLCHHLKIWGDRYKFPAEIKGSKVDIRPRLIIITSNYHPRDIWDNEKDLEPILRRFRLDKFTFNLFNKKEE